ncbi:hypothetical protein L1D34_07305 [Vibrio mediterranei]|uniref:DUF6950 family protein n=1 Tax=Vibrio mediterranei TaxID=689 RepID=UPI001EFCFB80|nr:hypothetical protein [Vibrio mediterranei]MCG9624646.1 hypothetical protein [Vibrio mediterranei]
MMEQLHNFLATYRDTSFETGVNDCALFVAAWIKLCTGQDLAAHFHGRYCNDAGSHRLIRKQGFKHLKEMVHSLGDDIGERLDNPLLAQRGDVVWLNDTRHCLCGIVCSSGIAVLSDSGLSILPLHTAITAWRIPISGEVL